MERKQILSLFLAFLLCVSSINISVLAQDSQTVTARIVGDTVIVTGEFLNETPGTQVNFIVLPEEVTLEEMNEKQGIITEEVVYLDDIKLDENKAFEKTINLKKMLPTGKYTLYVGTGSQAPISILLNFYQPAEIKEALNAVNQTSAANLSAILNAHGSILGLDLSEYNQADFSLKRQAVNEAIKFKTYQLDLYTQELITLHNTFGQAMLKNLLEVAKNGQELDRYYSKYKTYVTYDAARYALAKTEGLLDDCVTYLKGKTFADIEDALKELTLSTFFARFNDASSKLNMELIFNEYNQKELNISDSVFQGKNKQTVFGEVAQMGDVTSRADLLDKISKAIAKINNGGSGNPSRPSGGGGGAITYEPEPTPVPVPDPTVETYFSDLAGYSWAGESILKLVQEGVVAQDPNKQFRPGDSIRREEFVKLIMEALSENLSGAESSFSDVSKDAWYYSYILAATQKEYVQGISQSAFGVGANITREDIAVILYRICEKNNIKLRQKFLPKEFADGAKISSYAKEAIEALTGAGLLNGYEDNTFRPQGNATRAEAAVLINGFLIIK